MSDLALRPPRAPRMTPAGVAFGVFVSLFVIWCALHPRIEGDTQGVVWGSDAARACLRHGHLLGCPGVREFPLYQYLPAGALGALGVSDAHILRALAVLSALSFAGILLVAWRVVSRRAGVGAAVVVVAALASGVLLWYARSTFGEILAAFFILLFVETVLSRRGAVAVAGTFWLAGITKETALPFLLALGAVALFGPGRVVRVAAVRAQLIGLGVGAVLVFATTSAFNLFRFESIWNKTLLQPILRTPGLERRGELAVAIWAAPNGGVLPFWPLAVLLGAAALVWGLRSGRTGWGWWPAAALIGVAALLTAGFASWHSPFGWWTWGPRYELPWIPALLVLATVLYPRPASAVAEWVGAATFRRVAAGLIVAFAALPHLAALRSPDPLIRFFATDGTCPVVVVMTQVSTQYAFHCFNHLAWSKTPFLLDPLHRIHGGDGLAFALLLGLVCVGLMLMAPLTEEMRDRVRRSTTGRRLPSVGLDR